jgi:hypothetical protein
MTMMDAEMKREKRKTVEVTEEERDRLAIEEQVRGAMEARPEAETPKFTPLVKTAPVKLEMKGVAKKSKFVAVKKVNPFKSNK